MRFFRVLCRKKLTVPVRPRPPGGLKAFFDADFSLGVLVLPHPASARGQRDGQPPDPPPLGPCREAQGVGRSKLLLATYPGALKSHFVTVYYQDPRRFCRNINPFPLPVSWLDASGRPECRASHCRARVRRGPSRAHRAHRARRPLGPLGPLGPRGPRAVGELFPAPPPSPARAPGPVGAWWREARFQPRPPHRPGGRGPA